MLRDLWAFVLCINNCDMISLFCQMLENCYDNINWYAINGKQMIFSGTMCVYIGWTRIADARFKWLSHCSSSLSVHFFSSIWRAKEVDPFLFIGCLNTWFKLSSNTIIRLALRVSLSLLPSLWHFRFWFVCNSFKYRFQLSGLHSKRFQWVLVLARYRHVGNGDVCAVVCLASEWIQPRFL